MGVLTDGITPLDSRERWEEHLRGLMRVPPDFFARGEMIRRARKMIASKPRKAPASPTD